MRVAVVLLFVSAACATAKKEHPSPSASASSVASVLAAPAAPKEAVAPPGPKRIGSCKDGGERRFTLAHVNDLQARYSDRIAGKSRYAFIAGYLRALKDAVPATLVLDAGDDYEKGALAELRSGGETTRQMVQALPIDVRTIGNHDFAYGEQAVLRDVGLSAHPVLAANVRHIDLPASEQPFKPFVRVDVGCVKVGVIGLVTQNYGADDQPTKDAFDGVFAHDSRYAEVLEREIKAHRGEVDVLVALTHLGYWDDTALAMSPSARGLDLVVGAHTEDLFRDPAPATRPDGTRTWILQAGPFGQTFGRADLVVNLRDKSVAFERYKIVDVDASLPVSDEVAALAEQVERDAEPDLRKVIGTTRSDVRLGKDMTDLVWRAVQRQWGADALGVGTDLFWSGLPKGDVTLQRLYDAVLVQRQPTGTTGFSSLWVVDVSGGELASLKSRLHSLTYDMYGPSRIDAKRRYRLVIDKRGLTYPRALFGDTVSLPHARFGGEMIDVLEAYARARSAKGQTID